MMALPNDLCEVLLVYTHLPTSREIGRKKKTGHRYLYNVVSKDWKSNQFLTFRGDMYFEVKGN